MVSCAGGLISGYSKRLAPCIDFPAVLQHFHEKYPQVEIAVRTLDTDEAPTLVRSRAIDLSFQAVMKKTILTGLETIPFAYDVLVAICSKQSHVAAGRSVSLEFTSKEEFIDLIAKRALRVMLDHVFLERPETSQPV